jgi:PQQ-dependent catabolism-associated CXXCW motif protein
MRWFLGFCTLMASLMSIAAQAAVTNPDAIAVIIGNRAYTGRDVPEVKYADRDAQAMKRYVIDVLGFDEKNVIYSENASESRLRALFGNETEPGMVSRWLRRDGSSDLFVYYSGHGVPGLRDGQSYLLPVDADPSAGQLNGYPLKLLYANLEKTSARTITVMLDACFAGQTGNGASLIHGASLMVRPADPAPASTNPRMTVLTASGADEVANWDDTDRHGLFTEYFLRAVYGAADSPRYGAKGDGHITVANIRSYLDKEMSYYAGRDIGRDQNATITGNDNEVLAAFQPGHPFVRPNLTPAPNPVVPAILPAPAAPTITPAPAAPPSVSIDPLVQAGLAARKQGQFDRAFQLFKQAAESGSPAGMNALGEAYRAGQGTAKDPVLAMSWFRRAADLGNAAAMNNYGFALDYGVDGTPGDQAEALKWYRRAADLGDPPGLNNLGYAYMNGRAIEKNPQEALRLYRKSADLGNGVAAYNIGEAYESARGVSKDDSMAFTWYRKGADLGYAVAMYHVGLGYENAKGVAEDWPQSVVWYRKGADLGNAQAMSNLAYALENGRGVTRDDAEAVTWYKRAADLNDVQANYELGQMYRYGRAGPVDMAAAKRYLQRAADLGSGPAKTALGEIQNVVAPAPGFTPPPVTPPAPADPMVGEFALHLTPANRIALQQGLTLLNYPTGGVDGEFGPMTRQAIMNYQRASGLNATGYLNQQTVERLVADIKARQASAQTSGPQSAPTGQYYGDERRDFGVQPQTWLQDNVGSPTPTSIPGGARVVYTQELIRALNTPMQTPFMIIDVLDGAPHASIRGALRMPLAGHGGTFNDLTQQTVVGQLNQATSGRKDTPLVFMCQGVRCWESYNAALRAMQAGYQHVYWYRGGLEAWTAAGQPTI